MKLEDHRRLLADLLKGSLLASSSGLISILFGLFGIFFNVVLTPDQQGQVGEFVRSALAFWHWFLIGGLMIIVGVLYRRLVPRVDIRFAPDGRYLLKRGTLTRSRVDLTNMGNWQERVSFRLNSIRAEGGEYLPIDRRGLQREAGRGTMPLKEPKYGHIAEYDTGREDAKIMVLTVSDKASGYQDDPISFGS